MIRITKPALAIWSYRLVRCALGIVFIWAGIVKLLDYRAFAELISWYELVPDRFLMVVAVSLPALEVLAGIGLLFDMRVSLEIITVLTLLFIGVLWFGILKGLEADCGCFSLEEVREHDSLRAAFYRDFVFLGMCFYLFWWRMLQKRSSLARG